MATKQQTSRTYAVEGPDMLRRTFVATSLAFSDDGRLTFWRDSLIIGSFASGQWHHVIDADEVKRDKAEHDKVES